MSKDSQDVRHQRRALLAFARQDQLTLTDFMARRGAARRSPQERQSAVFLARLEAGETLVVREVSRMGRSVGALITVLDALVQQRGRFLALKAGRRLEGKQTVQRKVIGTLWSLLADLERALIALRPKAGLAAARAAGKRLGRLKGQWGWSQLTGKAEEIQQL